MGITEIHYFYIKSCIFAGYLSELGDCYSARLIHNFNFFIRKGKQTVFKVDISKEYTYSSVRFLCVGVCTFDEFEYEEPASVAAGACLPISCVVACTSPQNAIVA